MFYPGGVKRARERLSGVWRSHPGQVSLLLLTLIAVVAVSPALGEGVKWTPDSLFYQAQMYELRGESQSTALHRAFSTPAAAALSHTALRGRTSWAWITYSAPFYRRRWVMPAIAAALYPLAGTRSLLYASMLGYVAFALLVYALLRRRFGHRVSLVTAAICTLLVPVRTSGIYPLSDSWGLALETAALLAAILGLERGGAWIALWVLSMLALSLARDATVVLVLGAAWWWLRTRTPRAAVVALTGLLSSIPAPALFRAPVVQQLSWELDGFHIPHPAGWSVVVHHLPLAFASVVRDDLKYPTTLALPYLVYAAAVVIVAAVIYMIRTAPHDDPFYVLARVAIVGGVLTMALSASYTSLRVELIFVPVVAISLAMTIDRFRLRARSGRPFPPPGDPASGPGRNAT
jgi:hypothetical protein